MTPLKTQAIATALTGDWDNAIILNKKLLLEDPNDIETLNRLAFAYSVLGKTKEAKSMYQKVLTLDIQNPIALKNLRRLNAGKSNGTHTTPLAKHVDSMFLEESGKTKVIELVNVAEPKIISYLTTGESLELRIKRLKIFVLGENNHYIGMLPDDIGRRLIKFVNGGNNYSACVKSVENRKVSIFIREEKRASRFKNQASFSSLDGQKTIPHRYSKPAELEEEPDSEDDAKSF